jgi:hypothetical protein
VNAPFSFEFGSLSSYWLEHFPNFYKTFLESSKRLQAAKGMHSPVFKRVFFNSKAFGGKQIRTYKFKIQLKELKKY